MKGWRTLLFNVASAVITVLVGYNWGAEFPQYPWIAAIVTAAGNFALRFITDTPVGSKS